MLPLGLQCVLLCWCLLMYVYGYSINLLNVKKTWLNTKKLTVMLFGEQTT